MGRSLALREVLDKHNVRCPRCACREANVVLDLQFTMYWQCVDCEHRWPATDEESALLLEPRWKTIH